MRDLRLYRLRCRSEMISESERKNHLGLITVEAATAAAAAAATVTATAASTEVGLFSLLGTRDGDEIVWRSAFGVAASLQENAGMCRMLNAHYAYAACDTCVCLPDCLPGIVCHSSLTSAVPEPSPDRTPTAGRQLHSLYVWSHLASRRLHLPLVLCHS